MKQNFKAYEKQEKQRLATVAVMAAFADGTMNLEEKAKVREVFEGLGLTEAEVGEVYRASILDRAPMGPQLNGLHDRRLQKTATDVATAVVTSDSYLNPKERAFLDSLRSHFEREPKFEVAVPMGRMCGGAYAAAQQK
jgi:tellurite resistance protein